jgi:hypothetical protein
MLNGILQMAFGYDSLSSVTHKEIAMHFRKAPQCPVIVEGRKTSRYKDSVIIKNCRILSTLLISTQDLETISPHSHTGS